MEVSVKDVIRYIDENRTRHLSELMAYLSIPSVSTKREHAADVVKAAEWTAAQFNAVGLTRVQIHQTKGHPIVTAESPRIANAPTVLIYGHYDVQPPEPLELWQTPPFSPTVRKGKIFARGAADDKGQVFIYMKAIEALFRVRGALPINIKVLIEGEEEIGSPHLVPFVKAHAKQLACDLILVSDTHMTGLKTPSITTGLRGISCLEVTVQCAERDLHSGTFGGTVGNPIQVLAEMLSACKNAKTGKVNIPGFYDGVRKLSPAEKRSLKALPHSDRAHARSVGAPQVFGEKGYSTLERVGARPTFEINGIYGGYTGEGVKTVLPCEARAKISMRLVPDQDPTKLARNATAFIKKLAPPHARVSVKVEKNQGWPTRVDPNFSAMKSASDAVKQVFGKAPLYTLEGGSIPIVADFKKILKKETILLGFGLPDDNLHAPNEKFDLEMLDRGIKTIVCLMENLAKRG